MAAPAAAAAAPPPRHHRRSSSSNPAFHFTNSPQGGPFAPMPALPRRNKSTPLQQSSLPPPIPPRPKPMFEFHNDDSLSDDDSSTSIDQTTTSNDRHDTSFPFPKSSSSPSFPSSSYARTTTPIVLANGKPLRPSLKSSSSSPILHTRAHSAPTSPLGQPDPPSPHLVPPPPPSPTAASPSSPHSSHKNVHFQEDTRLASVRVFHKAGRPRSVSEDRAWDDTETETEGYESNSGNNSNNNNAVPFPSLPLAAPTYPGPTIRLAHPPVSSPIPASPLPSSTRHVPLDPPHILLTSLTLHSSNGGHTLSLHGSLVVLNIAYEKQVTVRFTLDSWATTCEVKASWAGAGVLPVSWARAISPSAPAYDTFTFQIALSDLYLAHSLTQRTLIVCLKYTALGLEWWDNNQGSNYQLRFVEVPLPGGGGSPASHSTTAAHDSEKTVKVQRPGTLGRSYSAPVANKWSEDGFGAGLPTLKTVRAMNSNKNAAAAAEPRKRLESGVGVKWGLSPAWSASTTAWPSSSSVSSSSSSTGRSLSPPDTRLPLNLDDIHALSRGTGFSNFALPDLPATEARRHHHHHHHHQPQKHHRPHAKGHEHRQSSPPPPPPSASQHPHISVPPQAQGIPFPSSSNSPSSSPVSLSSAESSSGAQTPPESPYLNTKLTLKNYSAPGRSRGGSGSGRSVGSVAEESADAGEEKKMVHNVPKAVPPPPPVGGDLTSMPPPPGLSSSPPAATKQEQQNNHSRLPTPPASRSPSFTDATAGEVSLSLPAVNNALVANENNKARKAPLSSVPAVAATTSTSSSSSAGSPTPTPTPTPASPLFAPQNAQPTASTSSTSYAALLAKWCFHMSGPTAVDGAPSSSSGISPSSPSSSAELEPEAATAVAAPRTLGSSLDPAKYPFGSSTTPTKNGGASAASFRHGGTPRTGSLDDIPGHLTVSASSSPPPPSVSSSLRRMYATTTTTTELEMGDGGEHEHEYGSDPGPQGHGAGHGGTGWMMDGPRRVWT